MWASIPILELIVGIAELEQHGNVKINAKANQNVWLGNGEWDRWGNGEWARRMNINAV